MSSNSRGGRGRGRGRGGGGGGGWNREEWRQNEHDSSPRASSSWQQQSQQQQQRAASAAAAAAAARDCQQAGTSMQQLQLHGRPQQQQQSPQQLATSRGPQPVQQPVQHVQQQHQHQQQYQHNYGGRQHNRNRNWSSNGGSSAQHQQQHQHQQRSHHHNQQQLQLQHQKNGQQQQRQQVQQQQNPQHLQQQQQQQQQQRNEAARQHRGKRRRQTSGFYQGRAAEQHGAAVAAGAAAAAAATDPDELPGFTRCPVTGKYFRITADSSGLVGHRVSDVRAAERAKQEEEEDAKRREKEEENRKATARRPLSTVSLLSSLSLGRLAGPSFARAATACRMQQMPQAPTQVIDVADFLPLDRYADMHSVVGCEFLDVSADGETLTGCWAAAGSSGERAASLACSVRTSVAERGAGGGKGGGRQWLGLGSLRGAPVQVRCTQIVDMTMAPTDQDVTCLLYTTATHALDRAGGSYTVCEVSTRPVYLRAADDYDASDADIYNIQLRLDGHVNSCAWSAKSLKIGLGMERHAKIYDVLSGQMQKVETCKKAVFSQKFDQSGDTLFLGLQATNARVMDTRASLEKAAAVIPGSRNTCWMRLLQKAGPQVVLSTLEGKLCLYDIRRPCRALLSYAEHRANVGARAPTFVDDDEQFVFAVGSDWSTRVWSLGSGRLLHELQPTAAMAAAARARAYTDGPRPVYSRSWAGSAGQGALLVAAGPHVNVFRLGDQMDE